jgi:hypothetical protein
MSCSGVSVVPAVVHVRVVSCASRVPTGAFIHLERFVSFGEI